MKRLLLVALFISGLELAKDKPRVFVQGKGSEDTTTSGSSGGPSHWGTWGSRPLTHTMSRSKLPRICGKTAPVCCSRSIKTTPTNTVMLNRESKHYRGLLRTNSQIQVANRLGDVPGTGATHTVGNAAKDG